MKLSKILMLMGDEDRVVICEDATLRLPVDELYQGTVLDCYQHPRLLKRKVTFFYAIRDDLIIFIK